LEFCATCAPLPPHVRLAIVLDNFSPHLSTKVDSRVATGLKPTTWSWPTSLRCQLDEPDRGAVPGLALLHLDGTDHRTHEEQNSMIRRYIIWRNRNAHDKTLRELVKRAKRCLMRTSDAPGQIGVKVRADLGLPP